MARSRELTGALSLAGVTIGLAWLGVGMLTAMTARLAAGLGGLAERAHGTVTGPAMATAIWADASVIARVVAPPALIAAGVSLAASVAQTGFVFAPRSLEWTWQKISPSSGFSRFAPMTAGTELLKALVSVAVIGAVAYLLIRPAYDVAPSLVGMMPAEAAETAWDGVWRLLWRTSLALIVLAAAVSCAWISQPWVAGVLGSLDIVTLAGIYLHGSERRRSERLETIRLLGEAGLPVSTGEE